MNKVTTLIVYVDDIVLIGNNLAEMEKLKRQLAKEFETKDLRKLKYFVGIEVSHSNEGVVISSLSLEGYCTSLSRFFQVYSVCGRRWRRNSLLGRLVVGRPTFGIPISKTI